MRMMKINDKAKALGASHDESGGAFRLSSNNISHAGEPMSKFLDRMLLIEETEETLPSLDPTFINDRFTDTEHSWSSAKTAKEIKKVDQRVSEIVLNSKESDTDNKEILDARIDFEGKIHFTLGDAIRDQVNDLHKKIDEDVMKEIHQGINVYGNEESKIAGGGVYAKSIIISGQDTNMLQIDPLPGYSIMSASNGEYERCKFFVTGVANGEKDLIFVNRVIPSFESACVDILYVKLDK